MPARFIVLVTFKFEGYLIRQMDEMFADRNCQCENYHLL